MDRFVGDYAVLLWGEGEIKVNLPQELLPPGTREGSILRVSMELDEKSGEEQRDKIANLLQRLKEKNN